MLSGIYRIKGLNSERSATRACMIFEATDNEGLDFIFGFKKINVDNSAEAKWGALILDAAGEKQRRLDHKEPRSLWIDTMCVYCSAGTDSPLYLIQKSPVFFLDPWNSGRLSGYFVRMVNNQTLHSSWLPNLLRFFNSLDSHHLKILSGFLKILVLWVIMHESKKMALCPSWA